VDVAVSRRMGLFVVARLAARHGIRVRLRPASMGGLTALVWLPDEVIVQENAGLTGGFRRLDPSTLDDPALGGPSLGDPRFGDPGSGGRLAGTRASSADPGDGLPGRHASDPELAGAPQAAVEEALAAARVPRFTEGIADGAAEAGDVAADTVAPVMGAPVGLIVPPVEAGPAEAGPAASPMVESRLPIFESVESDWFRRSRSVSDAPDTDTATEAWSSPADDGWQAAEVAQEPVSSGLTAAGLPQRVPKANLVPGRAGLAGATAQSAPARSATQTQERLASFQRAVREARAAAQAGEADQGEEGNDKAD
jgi:hypothetical protein